MSSTNIENGTDILQQAEYAMRNRANAVGIFYAITCVDRTVLEQQALYAMGREPLAAVNLKRSKAGLYLLKSQVENVRVTNTLHSMHLTDSIHPKSRAFDVVLIGSNKKATYDLKVNVNKNQYNDYTELAMIGRDVGLFPGAYFSTPDFPHYQIVKT